MCISLQALALARDRRSKRVARSRLDPQGATIKAAKVGRAEFKEHWGEDATHPQWASPEWGPASPCRVTTDSYGKEI